MQDSGTFTDGGRDAGRDAGVPDAGPIDAGFQDIDIAQWCAARALAECFRDVRCLRIGDGGVEECVHRKTLLCDQAAFTLAVTTGRLQYLKPQATACLNGFNSGSCEDAPAACADIFLGLTAPGGSCLLESECNASGFCNVYDGQCPHRCVAWALSGAACNGFTTRCQPGFETCQAFDAGVEGCAPPRNEGQSCRSFEEDCREDLVCVSDVCVKRLAKAGESCGAKQGYPLCPAEYFCRQSAGTNPPPGTCEKRAGLGGACTGYASCLPSLHCSGVFQTGTCVGRGAEGEKCAGTWGCQDGFFCAPQTSRCTALPREGGDCGPQSSFYECAAGYFCDFDSTTCRARRPLGASCTYDSVCSSNRCEYSTLPDGGYGGRCVLACAVNLLADGGQ